MSKRAEERALEAYPAKIGKCVIFPEAKGSDFNTGFRKAYKEGYERAEKDLALTWGDVQFIDHFILQLVSEEREGKDWGDGEKFYTEVLNRFNKSKEEK